MSLGAHEPTVPPDRNVHAGALASKSMIAPWQKSRSVPRKSEKYCCVFGSVRLPLTKTAGSFGHQASQTNANFVVFNGSSASGE